MGSYLTEKYAPERRHGFVKAHLAVGVKSHIVLAVRVTDEHRGDSPQFIPLLRRLSEVGHTPYRVAADKAYLSRENLAGADALGIEPYVPFKVNSRGLARVLAHVEPKVPRIPAPDETSSTAAYHQRSNVESTFSAIKR